MAGWDTIHVWSRFDLKMKSEVVRFWCFEYESRTCHSSGCWYDKDHDVEEFDYHHRREEEEGAEKKNEDAAAFQIWRGAWVKELPLVHPKARLTHSSRPAVALWSYSSTSPPCSLNPRYFSWTQDICLLASENKRVATVWVILQQHYMPLFKAYNSRPWLGGSL